MQGSVVVAAPAKRSGGSALGTKKDKLPLFSQVTMNRHSIATVPIWRMFLCASAHQSMTNDMPQDRLV